MLIRSSIKTGDRRKAAEGVRKGCGGVDDKRVWDLDLRVAQASKRI
jgi:hypothetical protein